MNNFDLTRRDALRALAGGAALAIPTTALAAPADDTIPAENLTLPEAQIKIAERMHELCSELSLVLTHLHGGNWYVRVCPHFLGQPNYQVQPMQTSPELRLQQGLTMASAALEELQPGAWRQGHNLEAGFAIITNDEWRNQRRLPQFRRV